MRSLSAFVIAWQLVGSSTAQASDPTYEETRKWILKHSERSIVYRSIDREKNCRTPAESWHVIDLSRQKRKISSIQGSLITVISNNDFSRLFKKGPNEHGKEVSQYKFDLREIELISISKLHFNCHMQVGRYCLNVKHREKEGIVRNYENLTRNYKRVLFQEEVFLYCSKNRKDVERIYNAFLHLKSIVGEAEEEKF